MQSIGTALSGFIYELGHEETDPGFLRNHPGKGLAMINSTDRLRHHPKFRAGASGDLAAVSAQIVETYERAQKWCESPIERDMLAALLTSNWDQCGDPVIPVAGPGEAVPANRPIVILPQFQIGKCRLDFVILCRGLKLPSVVAVECDGAEFHDRDRDAQRDTYLRAFGIHVFRATGSAIFRAPEDVANMIVNLAQDRT
jgi:hypothetical protein